MQINSTIFACSFLLTAPFDYDEVSTVINFQQGAGLIQCTIVTAFNDALVEGDEFFFFEIPENQDDRAAFVLSQNSQTINIVDGGE